jgi:hypothetical protein
MIIELLKIILPSVFVFLAGYLAIERLLREETRRRKAELTQNNQKITTPVRLQAYERLTLFLERISPDSLLVRVNQPNLTARKLQSNLLQNIRAEWEHNLSQQLYVSNNAWQLVKNAKDNVIKLVNTTVDKLPPDTPAIKVSQQILETLVELENHPTSFAIDFLKKEVREIF